MAGGVSYILPYSPQKTAVPVEPVNGTAFALTTDVAYGKYIPTFVGKARVPCETLWLKKAAKFAGGEVVEPEITFAEIAGEPWLPDQDRDLLQVHANGALIIDTVDGVNVHGLDYRFYPGSTTQLQDPAIAAEKGEDYTPAFRRRAYIVFEDFPTEKYEGQKPHITVTLSDLIGARMELEDALKAYAEFKGFDPAKLVCEGLDGILVDGGITYEQDLPLKDFLALHGPIFGYWYFERGSDIVCRRPIVGTTFTVDRTIDDADLLPVDDDGAVHTDLPDQLELPEVLELGYYALQLNYQRSYAAARTRTANNPRVERLDSCFIITPQEAQSYAWNALWRIHSFATRHRIKLGPKHLDIEPADIVAFTHRGFAYQCLVLSVTKSADEVLLELGNVLTDETVDDFGGYGGIVTDISTEGDPLLAPVNSSIPVISGPAVEGETATRSLGVWTNTPTSYTTQWYRAGVAIDGATGETYVYVSADVSENITVQVTATNAAGSATATSAPTVPIAIAPPDSVAPVIATSATHGVAEGSPFSVTLTADESVTWTKTGGPDAAHFTLTGALLEMTAKDFESPVDAGGNNTYHVKVTATDAAGNTANKNIVVTVTDLTDTTPDAFTFTDITGATLSTVYTSNTITLAGLNDAAAISITGGTYDINTSGTFVSSAGAVVNGDQVRVRVTSSGSYSAGVSATLTVGGVSDTYTVTTAVLVGVGFSTTDKHPNFTLSNTDHTATATGGTNSGVTAAVLPAAAGAYEWEVTIDTDSGAEMGVGICTMAQDMDFWANTTDGLSWLDTGSVWSAGSLASTSTYTAGDVLRIRVDLGANTIAFRKNAGSWSSNVALSTNVASHLVKPWVKLASGCAATINMQPASITGGFSHWPELPTASSGAHRYWRVYCGRQENASDAFVCVAEAEMRLVAAGADQCSGGTASADVATLPAANAFDNNAASTFWAAAGRTHHWLKYDFGVGVTKAIAELMLTTRNDTSFLCAPSRGLIQYSDDNSTWVTVRDFSTISSPWTIGQTRTFAVPQ